METNFFIDLLSPWLLSSIAVDIYQDQEAVRFIYAVMYVDIFLMTLLCLQVLFTRLFDSTHAAKHQFHQNFLLMELLINFPVTLGVIGTLISISIAVAKAEGGNLGEVMDEHFDAAVVTTVIGGLVYGYCFLLQATLYRYLDRRPPEKA